MTDENTTTDTGAPATDAKPTETVEYWKTMSRKNEDRAKANAADAAELATLKAANKTEAEKAIDRVTAAEAEVAKVPSKIAEGLRDSLVTLGVVSEDDKVLLTASDPEALLAQVNRLTGRKAGSKTTDGNRAPLQGRTPDNSKPDPLRDVTRSLFGRDN